MYLFASVNKIYDFFGELYLINGGNLYNFRIQSKVLIQHFLKIDSTKKSVQQ